MENLAERAAAVHQCGKELQLLVPVPEKRIQEAWYDAWTSGSEHIDMEIQGALLEKSDSFSPSQHLATLKKLVDEQVFSQPVAQLTSISEALEVDTLA